MIMACLLVRGCPRHFLTYPRSTFPLHLFALQGPALYAYNDARFTKDDWEGIRMLCDSIKVKDPMKVGRFGLGFKSVFHVTGTMFIS